MGGIAEYTGSLVCQLTLDCAVAVALQSRTDRQLQIFSFNRFDDHLPFTFNMSIDDLARASIDSLRAGFAAPGRHWAASIAGCLYILHHNTLIDLNSPAITGLNLALLSTVPQGVGLGSATATEAATMMNLINHFSLHDKVEPMKIAAMCQAVETQIGGLPCGIAAPASSCFGTASALLRMHCQPHEVQPDLALPTGVRIIGINSNVRYGGAEKYDEARCAAFMGHTVIVNKMREMGQAAGRPLLSDPMRGYLANLDPDDYKRFFRPYVPQSILGEKFLADFGPTIDIATSIDPKTTYYVQQATDHHVLEARRVHRFAEMISSVSQTLPRTRERGSSLDRAGHLMYASHLSYTNDARLGADECDLLVKLAREREPQGIYGAKITACGCGGTVAVLCDTGDQTDAAIADILTVYEKQAGRKPEAFLGSSPGAWHVGTTMV
jgi:L-arabinokinase